MWVHVAGLGIVCIYCSLVGMEKQGLIQFYDMMKIKWMSTSTCMHTSEKAVCMWTIHTFMSCIPQTTCWEYLVAFYLPEIAHYWNCYIFCLLLLGTHNINLWFNGDLVHGSPFSVESYDANAINVSEIRDGMIGKPTEFTGEYIITVNCIHCIYLNMCPGHITYEGGSGGTSCWEQTHVIWLTDWSSMA